MDDCEACRNYYEELASVADMLRPRRSLKDYQTDRLNRLADNSPASEHSSDSLKKGWRWKRQAAAVFGVVVLAAGITVAAIHLAPLLQERAGEASGLLQEEMGEAGAGEAVRFSGVQLDSILSVVSAHYGKTVQFRNEEPRTMKLYTTWNPADSLQTFIGHLNMFDYLHLTLQEDTIFVESSDEEDAQ